MSMVKFEMLVQHIHPFDLHIEYLMQIVERDIRGNHAFGTSLQSARCFRSPDTSWPREQGAKSAEQLMKRSVAVSNRNGKTAHHRSLHQSAPARRLAQFTQRQVCGRRVRRRIEDGCEPTNAVEGKLNC